MPEMNENVSSGADEGLEQKGAVQEAAVLLRTAATALLSAAEIWSTNTTPAAKSDADVTAQAETAAAIDQAAEKPEAEAKSPEEPAFAQRLRPSEVLAEARFFSLQGKRSPEGPAAEARPEDNAALTPAPLASEVSIDV